MEPTISRTDTPTAAQLADMSSDDLREVLARFSRRGLEFLLIHVMGADPAVLARALGKGQDLVDTLPGVYGTEPAPVVIAPVIGVPPVPVPPLKVIAAAIGCDAEPALTIEPTFMVSTGTPHTAAVLEGVTVEGGPTAWGVTWLPGRALTRNQAITAMTIAEVVWAFSVPSDDPVPEWYWPSITGWAAELGVSGPSAVVDASISPALRALGLG